MTDPTIDQVRLERRAQTETRRRRENRMMVTVSDWGITNEQIKQLRLTEGKEVFWVPNMVIPLKVPSIGLDAPLLISEVEYEAWTLPR
jgi:prophage tail gpP-like protein